MTLIKGMTGGGTTTPDAHDDRVQKGKAKMGAKPAHHIAIRSFPLARQGEGQTVIGYSSKGTHAT